MKLFFTESVYAGGNKGEGINFCKGGLFSRFLLVQNWFEYSGHLGKKPFEKKKGGGAQNPATKWSFF